jgi:hypothetical protein
MFMAPAGSGVSGFTGEQKKQIEGAMQEHLSLPSALRNKKPWGTQSRFVHYFFNRLLPFLGTGRSYLDVVHVDGKRYYRITLYVPGRRQELYVTPAFAYYLGMAVLHVHHSGMLPSYGYFLVEDESVFGTIELPAWTAEHVVKRCAEICKAEELSVVTAVAHIRSVVDAVQHGEDIPKQEEMKPTFH